MSRRTAWKLCATAGITSAAQRRRRSKTKKQGPPVFDDFVQRVFAADAPNRLWLTDITEHWTGEGKLYCCAMKRRLLEPDRRLLDLGPDDREARRRRTRERRRETR
jgi:transposase InsO family protein